MDQRFEDDDVVDAEDVEESLQATELLGLAVGAGVRVDADLDRYRDTAKNWQTRSSAR